MINDKIHHFGMAVNDLEKSKYKYLSQGYNIICSGYDEVQLSWICLLDNKENKKTLELVYSNNCKSPVFNLCVNNKEKIYHICYKVSSISASIEKFKKLGFLKITNINYAKILNGNICFFYSKDRELIELLEVKYE